MTTLCSYMNVNIITFYVQKFMLCPIIMFNFYIFILCSNYVKNFYLFIFFFEILVLAKSKNMFFLIIRTTIFIIEKVV